MHISHNLGININFASMLLWWSEHSKNSLNWDQVYQSSVNKLVSSFVYSLDLTSIIAPKHLWLGLPILAGYTFYLRKLPKSKWKGS